MSRGGARPGAGRPKGIKNAPNTVSSAADDPKDFLKSVMRDESADIRVRLDAAKSLMPYMHVKLGEGGKKDEKARAAQSASAGKFAAAAPPKLALVGR